MKTKIQIKNQNQDIHHQSSPVEIILDEIQKKKWEAKGYDLLWEDLESFICQQIQKERQEERERVLEEIDKQIESYDYAISRVPFKDMIKEDPRSPLRILRKNSKH